MSWTRVQGFEAHDYTGNTVGPGGTSQPDLHLTLGSAIAVGDVILVGTTSADDPATLNPTITDSLGNAYAKLSSANGGGQYFGGGANQNLDAFICLVTNAGTPVITFLPNGVTGPEPFCGIKGSHFTGSDASSTRRDSKGNTQSTPGNGTDAIASPSVAAQSNDLLWAVSGDPIDVFTTIVAGTGFTGTSVDTTDGLLDEWKTAAGAGAATFTDGTHGSAGFYLTIAIAITPASSSSTSIPLVYMAPYGPY